MTMWDDGLWIDAINLALRSLPRGRRYTHEQIEARARDIKEGRVPCKKRGCTSRRNSMLHTNSMCVDAHQYLPRVIPLTRRTVAQAVRAHA
jgi:hypothetical protein